MYDPAPTLRKVTCPVLALNGELDLQVPSSLNLPAIKKALEAGGNIAPVALETISGWILRHTQPYRHQLCKLLILRGGTGIFAFRPATS